MGKLSGAVLSGFSRIFPTGDAVSAPAEIDLGPVQPVADLSRIAAYNASPGIFDGWWTLSETVAQNVIGWGVSNVNPFNSNNLPEPAPPGGWRLWVYGAWVSFTLGTPADFVSASISIAQSSNLWKIDTTGPTTEFLIFSGAQVRQSAAGYGFVAPDPVNHAWPIPIIEIGVVNNIQFILENGAVGNMQAQFTLLLRLLPSRVNP